MEKHIAIVSGGMDSVTMLYKLVKENPLDSIEVISFDYNQKHRKELKAAKKTCQKLGLKHDTIDIQTIQPFISNSALTSDKPVPKGHYADETMKQTVVPNRNMIMLSIAIGVAVNRGAKDVYYAAHSGDHSIYPDCRSEFVEKLNEVAKIANYQFVEIKAPFLKIDKGDIAIIGRDLGVDFSLTWSCYEGKEKPCGKCGACIERAEAFVKAGIKDLLFN